MSQRPMAPEPESEAGHPSLQLHALDSIRYIRRTMEEAASFTTVPGWGMVWIGSSALAAAWIASHQGTRSGWMAVWVIGALAAATLAAITMGL